MTVLLDIQRVGGDFVEKDVGWLVYSNKHYECRVYVCPEAEGGFYAYLPTLPGVVSEGETEEETLRNIEEAFRGVIKSYRGAGEVIPWTDQAEDKPAGAKELRIVVVVDA